MSKAGALRVLMGIQKMLEDQARCIHVHIVLENTIVKVNEHVVIIL